MNTSDKAKNKIVAAMLKDDSTNLKIILDDYKGSHAVKYMLEILTSRDLSIASGSHTLYSLLELL